MNFFFWALIGLHDESIPSPIKPPMGETVFNMLCLGSFYPKKFSSLNRIYVILTITHTSLMIGSCMKKIRGWQMNTWYRTCLLSPEFGKQGRAIFASTFTINGNGKNKSTKNTRIHLIRQTAYIYEEENKIWCTK